MRLKPVLPFLNDVYSELDRATRLHEPMRSNHEALAVIWEEFEELKAEVFTRHPDTAMLRKELVQLGAMVARMALDLGYSTKEGK